MIRRKLVYLVDYNPETEEVKTSVDGLPAQGHLVNNPEDKNELQSQIVEDLLMFVDSTQGVRYSMEPIVSSKLNWPPDFSQTLYISVSLGKQVRMPEHPTTQRITPSDLCVEDCRLVVEHECVFCEAGDD